MPGRGMVALGVIVLAVTGPAAAAPPETLAAYCKVPPAKGEVMRFNGLTGAVVGSGKVGIVLANTSDGHICDWVLDDSALMAAFAKDGYRVLLFEWHAKTEAAQAANPTPGNLGAESFIASQVSGQVTNRVEKIAGLSQLSVDPVLGGNGQDPGARVTVQQRVTGNMFVTFATDATSTQRQVIKLEYQATPRVAFSGVRDQNGGFAFDVRIKKTW